MFGWQGLLNIVITLPCIVLSWWALKAVRFDVFVRNISSAQSRMLQLILSVALGRELGGFFIDYLHWSSLVRELL